MKFRTLLFTIIFTVGLCPVFGNELYKTNVTASFYAEDFDGKVTSSGEIFNMNDLTCAHKSLPFNSILKITNKATGATTLVRVNDRGPFVLDREIDLSKGAAIQLGMFGTGTATVDIEIVVRGEDTELSLKTAAKALAMMQQLEAEKAAKLAEEARKVEEARLAEEAKKAEEAAALAMLQQANQNQQGNQTQQQANNQQTVVNNQPAEVTTWDIQLGAFVSKDNANTLAQRLLKSGFTNVVFQNTSDITRVVIRDVKKEDIETLTKELKSKGFGEFTVRKRANVIEVTDQTVFEK